MTKDTLDIIIPLYNPKASWAEDLVRQLQVLEERIKSRIDSRVIIVDDGSTLNLDDGKAYLKANLSKLTLLGYPENKGKGYALRTGVKASTANLLMYTDHDIPYTYGSMEEIIDTLSRNDHTTVIGHRDSSYYQDLPFFRVKLSHYLKTINRFILGLNTDDTQCGLKGFRKRVKPIFLETKTNRFMIDIEFLRRLKRANISVAVIDVKSRENVIMSTLGLRTIASELYDYAKIFFTT